MRSISAIDLIFERNLYLIIMRHPAKFHQSGQGLFSPIICSVEGNDLTRTRWITEDSYFSDYLFDTRPFLLVPHRLISKRKSGLVTCKPSRFSGAPMSKPKLKVKIPVLN